MLNYYSYGAGEKLPQRKLQFQKSISITSQNLKQLFVPHFSINLTITITILRHNIYYNSTITVKIKRNTYCILPFSPTISSIYTRTVTHMLQKYYIVGKYPILAYMSHGSWPAVSTNYCQVNVRQQEH